jgi:hypothetical protein
VHFNPGLFRSRRNGSFVIEYPTDTYPSFNNGVLSLYNGPKTDPDNYMQQVSYEDQVSLKGLAVSQSGSKLR